MIWKNVLNVLKKSHKSMILTFINSRNDLTKLFTWQIFVNEVMVSKLIWYNAVKSDSIIRMQTKCKCCFTAFD